MKKSALLGTFFFVLLQLMLSGGFWYGSMCMVQVHRYQTHARKYVHRDTKLIRLVFHGNKTFKEINYHGSMYDVVFSHCYKGRTVCYMRLDAEENAWLSLSEKFAHPKSDKEKSAQQLAGFLLNMQYMHPSSGLVMNPTQHHQAEVNTSSANQMLRGYFSSPYLPPEGMNDLSLIAL
ncbi:MAG: hypothetical protein ACK5CV_04275 [Bacteroidota bacterium]